MQSIDVPVPAGWVRPVRFRFRARPVAAALLSWVMVCLGALDSAQAERIAPAGGGLTQPETSDDSSPGDTASPQFVLGPTQPGKWGYPEMGTGAVVTYSFATGEGYTGETASGGKIVPLESFIPLPRERIVAEFRRAFDAWEAVADLRFVEVPDDGKLFGSPFTQSGDVRIGGHMFDGPAGTLAHAFFPPSVLGSGAGDIHFDTADNWTIGFGMGGYDIAYVAAHEIGHAIGLNHVDNPEALMYAFYQESFFGPQPDDIAGAVFLYGPAETVPEPGAFVLLATAAIGLLVMRRRKRAGSAFAAFNSGRSPG